MNTEQSPNVVEAAVADAQVEKAKARVATRAAVGAGGGTGLGVLVVWLAGYFGVNMTAEVGAIIGGFTAGFVGTVRSYGVLPLVRELIFGPKSAAGED